MLIYVTQADIDAETIPSLARYCETCPVSRAISRQTKLTSVSVSLGRVFHGPPRPRWERANIGLPPNACEAIHNFDMGGKMEPFEFELEIDE